MGYLVLLDLLSTWRFNVGVPLGAQGSSTSLSISSKSSSTSGLTAAWPAAENLPDFLPAHTLLLATVMMPSSVSARLLMMMLILALLLTILLLLMLLVLLLDRCSRLHVLMFDVHRRTRQGTCTLRSFCTARIDALYAALWIRPLRSCATKLPNLLKMTTSLWSVTSRAATNASCTPATRTFMFTWVPISVSMCSLLPSWSCTPCAVTYFNPLAGDANPNISPTCSGHADTELLESRLNSIFSYCSSWRWCDTVQQFPRLQSPKDPAAAVCGTDCCRFCCWGSLQFSPVPLLLSCSSSILPLYLCLCLCRGHLLLLSSSPSVCDPTFRSWGSNSTPRTQLWCRASRSLYLCP